MAITKDLEIKISGDNQIPILMANNENMVTAKTFDFVLAIINWPMKVKTKTAIKPPIIIG